MTKEQAIKHLKLMQSGARNAIRHARNDKEISEEERKEDIEIYQDQLEALKIATKELEHKTGEWETDSNIPDRLICSCCNTKFDMWCWEQKNMHYCPNCGAEMEGGENG